MDIAFVGFTLDVVGKLLIAYTSIRVHHRVWQEHKIDQKVFAEMKSEQYVGVIGMVLVIAGYFLQAPSKLHL